MAAVATQKNPTSTTNDDTFDAISDVSMRDSPPHRRLKLQAGQPTKTLQDKRRRAQMRLVSVKRGSVNTRSGEPRCLEMFVADVQLALERQCGKDGRFVSTSPHAGFQSVCFTGQIFTVSAYACFVVCEGSFTYVHQL